MCIEMLQSCGSNPQTNRYKFPSIDIKPQAYNSTLHRSGDIPLTSKDIKQANGYSLKFCVIKAESKKEIQQSSCFEQRKAFICYVIEHTPSKWSLINCNIPEFDVLF